MMKSTKPNYIITQVIYDKYINKYETNYKICYNDVMKPVKFVEYV